MENVEFTEESNDLAQPAHAHETPTLVRWVLKTGIVKEEKQANYLLLGIAVVLLAITVFAYSRLLTPNNTTIRGNSGPMYYKNIPPEILEQLPPDVLSALPEKFYKEDLPKEVLNKIDPKLQNFIPSRPSQN